MTALLRAVSALVALALTGAYLFFLYGLTWYHCFGESAGCAAGWLPRTIATAVYLLLVVTVITATRWLLRAALRRAGLCQGDANHQPSSTK